MAIPKAYKFKKNGIEYISSFDRAEYTLYQLARAALRDSGKLVCKETKKKVKRRTGKSLRWIQYWVRKKEGDLLIGYKPPSFYLGYKELGVRKKKMPKEDMLHSAVKENINEIRKIQGKYLKEIENENRALSIISESDYEGEG